MTAEDWANIIMVYMQRRPEYKVKDYLDEFHPTTKNDFNLTDEVGRVYDPTYIVHEVIRMSAETLYTHYRETTFYNKYTMCYTLNDKIEAAMPPIIRFHLIELRKIQITTHKDAPITPKTIRDYLCFNNTFNKIHMLVNHFATSTIPDTSRRSTTCFILLRNMLTQ